LKAQNWRVQLNDYSDKERLPSQLDATRDNLPCVDGAASAEHCTRRNPDFLLVSAGGNDVGFAQIVADAVLGKKTFDGKAQMTKWATLDANYARLKEALNGRNYLNNALRLFGEYPNPLFFKGGSAQNPSFCNRSNEDAGRSMSIDITRHWRVGGLSQETVEALQAQVVHPLVVAGAKSLTPEIVSGWEAYTRTQGHGYCKNGTSWVYSFREAMYKTGFVPYELREAPSGTMHPNLFGHLYYSTLLCKAMVQRDGRGDAGKAAACEAIR
jgi:hypothetical protein